MSSSRRPGSRRPRPSRTPGGASSRYPVAAPRRDALDFTRAVFAGVEGVLLSWIAVLVPALIAYVVTAAAPSLGDASWQTAVRTATAFWLVGAGGTMETAVPGAAGAEDSVAAFTLVPLGLSLVTVLALAWTARRQGIRDLPTAAVTAATVVVTHLALSFLSPTSGGRLRLVLGSLVIAAVGVALSRPGGVVRRRWPALVRDAGAITGRVAVPLAALFAVLVAVAAVLGRDEVSRLHDALAHDAVSAIVLVLAQLAFLPNVMTWALSFAAGPGFIVGEGTSFTSTDVVTAPLPAVPFLGGLPHPGPHDLMWLALPIVMVGLAAGAWAARRRPRPRLRDALAVAGAGSLGVAVATLLLGFAASGGIGPERMGQVGVPAALTALAVGLEVGAGLVIALVALHPHTRATVRGWFTKGAGAAAGGAGAVKPAEAGADGADDLAEERAGEPADAEAVRAAGPDEAAEAETPPGAEGEVEVEVEERAGGFDEEPAEESADELVERSVDKPSDALDEDDEPAVLVAHDGDAAHVSLEDPYQAWVESRAPGAVDEGAESGVALVSGSAGGGFGARSALSVAERAAAREPVPEPAGPAGEPDGEPDDARAGAPALAVSEGAPAGPVLGGGTSRGRSGGDVSPRGAQSASGADAPRGAELPGTPIEPAPRTGLTAWLGRRRRN